MKLRRLGGSDIHISPIIMGTWLAGKAMWGRLDCSQTCKAIRTAFDAGINTFDTAEVYGTEQILGRTLRRVRDRVVIATKVFPNHLGYNQLFDACERSLINLQTDYIDLYQVHWPPGEFGTAAVPMEEIMEALNALQQQGKIRSIGVSNFNRRQLETAAQCGEIVSLQPPYSLFWRHIENDIAAYCRKNGITVLAYAPMAQGLLTGKFGPDHLFESDDHHFSNRLFQPPHFQRAQKALRQLKPIADARGISLGQLALAWVVAQSGTCAIAGARTAEQVLQNAAAARISLTAEELRELDAISRSVTDHFDDNPVIWSW